MVPSNKKSLLKNVYILGERSVIHLGNNNPLVLASSTAFFATFSLAPIVMIIITLIGLFFNDKLARAGVLDKVKETFGSGTASTVESVLNNLRGVAETWYVSLFGFLFLIFISTTLLIVVQDSINQLWGLRQKPERHVQRVLKDRLISLVILMVSGLLILTSLLTQTVLAFIRQYLHKWFPDLNLSLLEVLNEVISFLIVAVWFAAIYKFLPAAKMKWKPVWVGSIVTSILFTIGRFLLIRLLPETNINSIYGASGSIVLILLFVFYSALIFYLGASFTRMYTEFNGDKVKPKPYAVRVKVVEIE